RSKYRTVGYRRFGRPNSLMLPTYFHHREIRLAEARGNPNIHYRKPYRWPGSGGHICPHSAGPLPYL
ncbi:MAG: hypothetical protein QXR91_03640, partial [Nitrososphaerales archaeon]